ncbi:hypothetical protein [Vibrio sagamiensis]|uniref:Uncharacterized protein n=1 Tax=Vibrio sagamiensis NBRC 104589 TaxID=1219064 RepID=A0A511QD74_9VIBR|nr:hypothetical protein [Vibrio sagamiensis]PNQ55642.1 hypothetical protein C1141_14155 [Vibrio agarivorans]GEM75146.1 hypothetical protein VSA01S_12580 [Vibrio sagamiensis NBRC 104589]
MMEKQTLTTEIITQEQAETSACFSRFGKIISINPSTATVRVDFEGNPFKKPLTARLSRLFKREELQIAIDNNMHCRIEFLDNDISLPVVTDIVFSMLVQPEEFIIRAKKMVIETEQELIVRSGETETRYSGRDGRVITKGKYVTSQAEKTQKIQGGTVAIN